MKSEINEVMDHLSTEQKFKLFQGMVVQALMFMGYIHDPFETAKSLDMSFEEISEKPIDEWIERIGNDAVEYRDNCPERFSLKH